MINRLFKQHDTWKICSVGSLLLLVCGFLWARLAISYYQHIEGTIALNVSSRGEYYEYWALTLPSYATFLSAFACLAIGAVLHVRRRDFPAVLLLMLVYSMLLGIMYIFLFAGLGFEAFD